MANHINRYGFSHFLFVLLLFAGSFALGVIAGNNERWEKVEPMKQKIKDVGIDSTPNFPQQKKIPHGKQESIRNMNLLYI